VEGETVKIGYVRLLAWKMGLGDWHITLDKMLPNGDALAQVHITYGQKRARIQLSRQFKRLPREGQRQTLVHELVHCHLERVRLSSLNWTGPLGKKATQMAVNEVHDHIEFAVDAIATAWAETLPLPPLPEGK